MKRYVGLLAVLLIALLAFSWNERGADAATTSRSVSSSAGDVAFSVNGLPPGVEPQLFVDVPAQGGGYLRVRSLGAALRGSTTLDGNEFLEAAPVPRGVGERYVPSDRFQADGPIGKTLSFDYVHEYLVTISRESHGPADPAIVGRAAGATSAESQWVRAGATFSVTASGEGRYHFARWTVEGLTRT